jgi:hypothetical protein
MALSLCGALFSGWREYQNALSVSELVFNQNVEEAFNRIDDSLKERETLARAVGAAFNRAEIAPGVLNSVDQQLLEFIPDVYSFVWAPRVSKRDLPEVLKVLEEAGVPQARILGPGGKPLPEDQIGDPLFPILDILPKSSANLSSLGLDLTSLPVPREALQRARETRSLAATAPLNLVQLPNVKALVLYMPIRASSNDASYPSGYLGFSFRLDRLLGVPLSEGMRIPVRVSEANEGQRTMLYEAGAWDDRLGFLSRTLSLGGGTTGSSNSTATPTPKLWLSAGERLPLALRR